MFKNYSKTVKIFLLVYFLISIITLLYIWIPKGDKTPNISYYKEYTEEDIAQKMGNYYGNELYMLLMLNQQDALSRSISSDYLEYNNLTNEEVIDDIDKLNLFNFNVNIASISVINNNEEYIYSFNASYAGKSLRFNIIENEPYNYSITLGEFLGYKSGDKFLNQDGLEVAIYKILSTASYIEYEIMITNESVEKLEFNLASYTDCYLYYNNGSKLGILNPLKLENEELSKGDSIKKNIRFEVPIDKQEMIAGITFENVVINNEKKTLKFDI